MFFRPATILDLLPIDEISSTFVFENAQGIQGFVCFHHHQITQFSITSKDFIHCLAMCEEYLFMQFVEIEFLVSGYTLSDDWEWTGLVYKKRKPNILDRKYTMYVPKTEDNTCD